MILGSTEKVTCPLPVSVSPRSLPHPHQPHPQSLGQVICQAVCTCWAARFHSAPHAGAGRAAGESFDQVERGSPRPQLFSAHHIPGSLITLPQSVGLPHPLATNNCSWGVCRPASPNFARIHEVVKEWNITIQNTEICRNTADEGPFFDISVRSNRKIQFDPIEHILIKFLPMPFRWKGCW